MAQEGILLEVPLPLAVVGTLVRGLEEVGAIPMATRKGSHSWARIMELLQEDISLLNKPHPLFHLTLLCCHGDTNYTLIIYFMVLHPSPHAQFFVGILTFHFYNNNYISLTSTLFYGDNVY